MVCSVSIWPLGQSEPTYPLWPTPFQEAKELPRIRHGEQRIPQGGIRRCNMDTDTPEREG